MNPQKNLGNKPSLSHWDFPDDAASTKTYLAALEQLQKLFIDVQRDAFSLSEFEKFVNSLVSTFQSQSWGLFRVFLDQKVFQASTASTCLNTALVCFLFARANAWSGENTGLLVRAALLHDIGMLFLPPSVLLKEGKLSEKERAILESHPSVSFELVKKWGESFEATQVALQHHEEWNGTGYPSKAVGSKIHPWAGTVAVCLNFVARVTQRGYRNSVVGYEAVKKLIQDQNVRFQPSIVKDFVKTTGLYPPGSILLLSDGSIARVIALTHTNVMRPQIRILIDHFGSPFRDDRGPLFELSEAPKLFIARPVNLEDLFPKDVN
ncbi:MAG: HD domain-containing phosphohydrolase [Spirochaetales bacterium]